MTNRQWWLAVLAGVLLMHGLSLGLRPLMPVDETRYLGVAWEMWRDHSFLVPLRNGAIYTDKPPLLFWLIHLGWMLFGVNEWTPRLLLPGFTLASVLGLRQLAGRWWPQMPDSGRWSGVLLLGSGYFAVYQTAVMFDGLLLACVVWSWWALAAALQSGRLGHWLLLGLFLGVGLLGKGPVVWVYTLPMLLAVRVWLPTHAPIRPIAVGMALLVMLAVPGLWLLLAAWQGAGVDYFQHLLVQQAVDRIEGDLGHPRPLYWYLPLLVLLPMPWWLWPPVWPALAAIRSQLADSGMRALVLAMASGFVVLSVMDSKQAHYLLPLLALAALGLARLLVLTMAKRQVRLLWRCLALSSVLVAVLYAAVFVVFGERYRVESAAAYVGEQQRAGRAVAVLGHYHNEFAFYGRLRQPVDSIWPQQVPDWLQAHPDGLLVARAQRIRPGKRAPHPEFDRAYRGGRLQMFAGAELVAAGARFQEDSSDSNDQ